MIGIGIANNRHSSRKSVIKSEFHLSNPTGYLVYNQTTETDPKSKHGQGDREGEWPIAHCTLQHMYLTIKEQEKREVCYIREEN
jgi:hypothetical protein